MDRDVRVLNIFSFFVDENNIFIFFVKDYDTLVKIVQYFLVPFVDTLCVHENEANLGNDYMRHKEVKR